MISVSALRPFSFLIGIVSAAAAVAAYFGLPIQITVWEIPVDGRIAVLIAALVWLRRKGAFNPELSSFGVTGWRLKPAIHWFLAPIAVLLVPAFIGMAAGGVSFKPLDNPETLLLGALFDIPAVYVFSAFTLLIEEAVFRSLLFRSELQRRSPLRALQFTSVLWLLYCLADITGTEGISLPGFAASVMFFFSSSLLWTALANSYRTIWYSYSFRIGLAVFNPILLTSMLFENDAFFAANGILFISEGILVSIIMLSISFILWRKRSTSEVP